MSWVAVIGAVGSIAGGVLNKKKAPKAVQQEYVDPQEAQSKALQGNLENLPGALELTKTASIESQKTVQELLEQRIPGFAGFKDKLLGMADESLSNPSRIPDDVLQETIQRTSELGLGTGIKGEAQNFNLAKNIGMNSLQVRQGNIQSATDIINNIAALNPMVSVASPFTMIMTPREQAEFQLRQNETAAGNAQSNANNQAMVSNWNRQNLTNSVASAAGTLAGVDWGNLGKTTTPTGGAV